jgi:hypothetical protein
VLDKTESWAEATRGSLKNDSGSLASGASLTFLRSVCADSAAERSVVATST